MDVNGSVLQTIWNSVTSASWEKSQVLTEMSKVPHNCRGLWDHREVQFLRDTIFMDIVSFQVSEQVVR